MADEKDPIPKTERSPTADRRAGGVTPARRSARSKRLGRRAARSVSSRQDALVTDTEVPALDPAEADAADEEAAEAEAEEESSARRRTALAPRVSPRSAKKTRPKRVARVEEEKLADRRAGRAQQEEGRQRVAGKQRARDRRLEEVSTRSAPAPLPKAARPLPRFRRLDPLIDRSIAHPQVGHGQRARRSSTISARRRRRPRRRPRMDRITSNKREDSASHGARRGRSATSTDASAIRTRKTATPTTRRKIRAPSSRPSMHKRTARSPSTARSSPSTPAPAPPFSRASVKASHPARQARRGQRHRRLPPT